MAEKRSLLAGAWRSLGIGRHTEARRACRCRPDPRPFRLELLEPRLLLAGAATGCEPLKPPAAADVAVRVVGERLCVQGGTGDDRIRIEPSGPGQFAVTGLDGTTVNGRRRPRHFHGVKDVIIALGRGNDSLLIGSPDESGVIRGDLVIQLGPGDDSAQLDSIKVRRVTQIGGGRGNDSARLVDVLLHDMSLRGGPGNDRVTLESSLFKRKGRISTGSGQDVIELLVSRFRQRAILDSGSGPDQVMVAHSRFDDALRIRGKRNDLLSLDHSAVKILTGRIPPGTRTTPVQFVYMSPTATDPDVAEMFSQCVAAVHQTHAHAGWQNFGATHMTPVGSDRWEITFSDVPVGQALRLRINAPNQCSNDNPTGAVTRNVSANGVVLTQVVDTPGAKNEAGFAFTVDADGNVAQ